jgi:hypothetical protein
VSRATVVIATALGAASLLATAAAAVTTPPMEDGTLSVRDGRASMLLRVKGSIIGRLAKGKITVTDSPAGATIVVRGWESKVSLPGRTTSYSGKGIRFRIADDHKFFVKLSGRGLNYTVVGRGDGWLDGLGDPAKGIFFDGSYSLNAEPYHSIPDDKTSFQLASPKPPGSGASG